jgi:hypothetical protein
MGGDIPTVENRGLLPVVPLGLEGRVKERGTGTKFTVLKSTPAEDEVVRLVFGTESRH